MGNRLTSGWIWLCWSLRTMELVSVGRSPPASALLSISNHPLPAPDLDQDSIIWKFTSFGQYTVKSNYKVCAGTLSMENNNTWRLIWQWKGPQRVRSFLWLTFHRRILTNEERAQRHLCASARYECCKSEVETIFHMLRDCPGDHYVWTKLLPSIMHENFFTPRVSLQE